MADKDLTYRVRIDDSDLSQRLAQIKQDIDFALAGQSMGGGQVGIERAVPMTYGSYGGLTPLPNFNQYISPTQAGIAITDASFSNAYQSANMSLQSAQTSLYNAYQQIGTTRDSVQSTFQNTINRVGVSFRDAVTNISPSEANYGLLGNDNWVNNLLGTIGGVGYNPDMAVSLGMFRQMQQHRLAYNMPSMIGSLGGFGLGFLGMGGGPLGIAVGLGAGFIGEHTIGAGLKMAFGAELQDMQTADYVNFSIAQRGTLLARQGGQGLFEGVGSQVAQRMRDYTRSPEGFLAGVSRTEAEQALKMYTDMGGFDTARSSEEYVRRFDDMLEGHKKIMHAFRISQQKAIQFMSEMQNAGLSGTAESAAQIQGAALSVGLGGTTLVDYGLQSQRTAWQSIPGLSAQGGFTMGIATLMTTQQMARQGILTNDFIARMGGGEEGIRNIASTMQGLGYSLAQTPVGRLQLQVGQAGFGMDAFSLAGAGIGSLHGLNDMVNFATGVNRGQQIEALGGPINMILSDVERSIQQMGAYGFERRGANGGYSEQDIKGFLISKGYTPNQAEAALRLAQTPIQTADEIMRNSISNEAKIWLDERPTTLQQIQANFSSALTHIGEGATIIGGGILTGAALGAGLGLAVGGIGVIPGAIGGAVVGGIAGIAGLAAGPQVRNRWLHLGQRAVNNLVGTSAEVDSNILTNFLTGSAEDRAIMRAEGQKTIQEIRDQLEINQTAQKTSFGSRSMGGMVSTLREISDKDVEGVLKSRIQTNEDNLFKELTLIAKTDSKARAALGNNLTETAQQIISGQLNTPYIQQLIPNIEKYRKYYRTQQVALNSLNSSVDFASIAGQLGFVGSTSSEIMNELHNNATNPAYADQWKAYGSLSEDQLAVSLGLTSMLYKDKPITPTVREEILTAQARRNEVLKSLPNAGMLARLQVPIDFENKSDAATTELTIAASLNVDDAQRMQTMYLKRLVEGQARPIKVIQVTS